MAKVGKKYAEAAKLVDRSKSYSIEEAVALAKQTNYAKFDASVEVSFRLNVDPRHADQQIRGAMVLPNGTGKSQKVLVITQGAKEQEAKDAGADFVGGKEMLDEIQKGWFGFDAERRASTIRRWWRTSRPSTARSPRHVRLPSRDHTSRTWC